MKAEWGASGVVLAALRREGGRQLRGRVRRFWLGKEMHRAVSRLKG